MKKKEKVRTFKFHSQTMRNCLYTLSPHRLVEFRIEANIRCTHGLLSERDDGFDCPWSTFFKGTTVHALMEMNCVLASNDVLERRTIRL